MEQRKNGWRTLLRAGLWIVLAGYAFVLIKIILLKYGLGAGLRSYNFVPFRFVGDLLHPSTSLGVALKNVLGNFAIFIPLGVLAPALWGRVDRWWKAALLGLGVSAAFEALQFLFGLGATDVDDLLLNTLGTAAGAGLYFGLFRRLAGEWKPKLAALLFLCMFGGAGLLALWLYAPGELSAVVERQSVEALGGLDLESYTVSVAVTDVSDGQVACSQAYDANGKVVPGGRAYPLADGAAIYLVEMNYQFSPNGNIQKTICTYSICDLETAKTLTQTKPHMFADLWLNGEGVCTTMVLTVYPE